MAEEKKNVVDELEEKSLEELDSFREEDNKENEQVVDEGKKQIKDVFDDLRQILKENSDPEKIKENLTNAKDNVLNIVDTTRKKAVEVSNSDNFKQTIDASKDLIEGATGLIVDGFKTTTDILMSNDKIADLVDKADKRLDIVRESEGLKKGVDAAEELTDKFNKAVFGGIQKFFDKKDEGSE